MKKIYFSLLISGLAVFNGYSQPGNTAYLTGIPGATLVPQNISKRSAFVIDQAGNKWTGFSGGTSSSFQLLRYNGSQWDTFPAFNSLSSVNKVYALAVDASNNIWIGSNMGLSKFDGTTFTTFNTANSTLKSDTILSLACGNGNVYAGTYHGLSVYNGSSFTHYSKSVNGMKSDSVNCIAIESATAIWLGNNYGLEKFNGSTFSFTYLTGNLADVVNCIFIDAQNNKWIGTNAHGLLKYNNSSFFTLAQLNPTLMQEQIGLGGWPTTVKSLCRGFHGGVFFGLGSTNALGCMEITANQNYTYPNLNAATIGAASTAYTLMQFDPLQNKLFYTSAFGGSATQAYLFSYDGNQTISNTYPYNISANNSAFLDINNITALITDNSNQHWDQKASKTKYFAPKQNNTSPLFASSMWIGGYANNTIHMAAMTYRQNGYDFWPGPLDTTNIATADTATMNAYNHVWKINRYDIANFIYNWNAGNVQNGTFFPVQAILTWPAQGSGNYSRKMAPYVDVNHNGVYDPIHDGDYPLIKGDQMIWSVYNDGSGGHSETNGLPLGIEVHASAYAFVCPNITDSNAVLNNSTFYNYQIFNRSTNQYDSTIIGLWIDSDLGNYADDYIGCDVMNDFGFTYNGDNYDEDNAGNTGYHANLPVFACNVLAGPLADPGDGIDNNHNCLVDEPGEKCMMNGFSAYNNSGNVLDGNPSGYSAYYNLINAEWENGTPMGYGNSGLTSGGAPCKYLYPGNSDPYGFGLGAKDCNHPVSPPNGSWTSAASGWTEGQAGNAPGDRRFMVNIGKFTMKPQSMYEVDYALVFTQDSVHCDSNNTCPIARAVQDNKMVKRWYNANNYPSCLSLAGLGIQSITAPVLDLKLYPNPSSTFVYLEFASAQKNVNIEVFDMLGNLVLGLQYNDLSNYASIPVAALTSGVYLVKIQSANGTANKKFIKE